jgi:hypothetical protein
LTQQRELFGDEYQKINVIGGISKSLHEVINQMAYLTELACHFHARGHDGSVAKALIIGRNEVQHALLSFPTAQQDMNTFVPDGDDRTGVRSLVEAARIAALVFTDLVLFPLPWNAGIRPRLARRLQIIWTSSNLSQRDDKTRAGISELKIWILWVGSFAALHTPNQSWFETTLRGHISPYLSKNSRTMTFEAIKPVLRGFLWFEPVCDQPARDLWKRMFNLRDEFEDIQRRMVELFGDLGAYDLSSDASPDIHNLDHNVVEAVD